MSYLNILYFNELDSTNEYAKKICSNNFENFTTIVADKQTKGKGRNSREWFSPKGENLYFSVIIKPNILEEYLTSIPIIAGFSVIDVLEEFLYEKIFIKWPNDIMVNNRKISGILTEYYNKTLIIGIGLNVNSRNFPKFEYNIPTSIFLEKGEMLDRLTILCKIIEKIKENYNDFLKYKKIPDKILEKINERLYLKGEDIIVVFSEKEENGKILEVLEDGSLKLDNKIIYAGEIKKIKRRM